MPSLILFCKSSPSRPHIWSRLLSLSSFNDGLVAYAIRSTCCLPSGKSVSKTFRVHSERFRNAKKGHESYIANSEFRVLCRFQCTLKVLRAGVMRGEKKEAGTDWIVANLSEGNWKSMRKSTSLGR